MRDDELIKLLAELGPEGLGPLPANIALTTAAGKLIPLSEAYDELEEVNENDTAHLFGKKPEEKKEDPIQAAIKKDPLFGSW